MTRYATQANQASRRRPRLITLAAMIIGASLVVGSANAQEVGRDAGPVISALAITVEDMGSRRELGAVSPGDTVEITVGQQVRLRMTGVPANDNRGVRYPSTRFTPPDGVRQVSIDKVNPEVGSIIVTGVSPHTGPGAVVLMYEILEPLRISQREMTGRVYVRVVDAVRSEPSPQPDQQRRGVTLFADANYGGRSMTIWGSLDRLDNTTIGNDRVSSIRVDPGCRAVLYRDVNYRGASAEIVRDVANLGETRVGNDSVSSIEVDCSTGESRGVELFEHADFRGRSEFIVSDERHLGPTNVGNDTVSSVRVSPGCVATLFADADFRGASSEIREDRASLANTRVGADSASSVRIRCN